MFFMCLGTISSKQLSEVREGGERHETKQIMYRETSQLMHRETSKESTGKQTSCFQLTCSDHLTAASRFLAADDS